MINKTQKILLATLASLVAVVAIVLSISSININKENTLAQTYSVEYYKEQSKTTVTLFSKGPEVLTVKARLHELDYLSEENNNDYFNLEAFWALRKFQKDNGLTMNGVLNEETNIALFGAENQKQDMGVFTSDIPQAKLIKDKDADLNKSKGGVQKQWYQVAGVHGGTDPVTDFYDDGDYMYVARVIDPNPYQDNISYIRKYTKSSNNLGSPFPVVHFTNEQGTSTSSYGINQIQESNGYLYASDISGSDFKKINLNPLGTEWTDIPFTGPSPFYINDLSESNNKILAGGKFSNFGNLNIEVDNFVKWNGLNWTADPLYNDIDPILSNILVTTEGKYSSSGDSLELNGTSFPDSDPVPGYTCTAEQSADCVKLFKFQGSVYSFALASGEYSGGYGFYVLSKWHSPIGVTNGYWETLMSMPIFYNINSKHTDFVTADSNYVYIANYNADGEPTIIYWPGNGEDVYLLAETTTQIAKLPFMHIHAPDDDYLFVGGYFEDINGNQNIKYFAVYTDDTSLSYVPPAPNTWTQKANIPISTREAVSFRIGGQVKGYLGTGYSSTGNNGVPGLTDDFWEYNPSTNTWTQKADFGGGPRNRATGFSIGSKGYIGTGFGGTQSLKDFWEYNPSTNTWTQKADFGGIERKGAVGFAIGSKGYIGTGFGGGQYLKDFWEYNPSTNTWTQKADFGGDGRSSAVGFAIGSKGYIGTGLFEYYNGTYWEEDYKKDFWEYSPFTNTWTQKADFGGEGRHFAAGFALGLKGYIGTGLTEPLEYLQDFWEYNPSTNTWTQKADFGGEEMFKGTGFFVGSKGYISTGYSPNGSSGELWEYNP